jgi:predicted mannosyl-3-phosphoglycerate phosphatase (HAD superfamily)
LRKQLSKGLIRKEERKKRKKWTGTVKERGLQWNRRNRRHAQTANLEGVDRFDQVLLLLKT